MKQYNKLRRFLNRFGWDFCRYRKFLELLELYQIDLVIDVGANVGQFAQELRYFGYKKRILSYEPCEAPFKILKQRAEKDPAWECENKALGDETGTRDIKVYNDSRFASFRRIDSSYNMNYKNETVRVSTLDDEFKQNTGNFQALSHIFIKIDTQGFERQVLEGAVHNLQRICGVLIECSLTPLYSGQWYIEEAFQFMRSHGYAPWALRRGFMRNNREMELDVIFFRENASHIV